ncbi:polysaccharide deacetylase family protein [Blautia sp. BX19]|nr:polysaccharide deacetylase family protein [Blautia tarda]
MKYLNCIKQWLHTGKIIRETDFLTCCVVLIACFFVGAAIHCHTEQEHLETSGQILHPETENWGLGFGQTGEKPTGNVSAEELKKYHAAYMDPTDEKVIYLTFDAGYENGNTPAILEALKKHDASATFFVVGNYLETSPELVKQMVAEGHTVGNHTFHHPEMSKISDAASFEKELKDVETLYQKITGEELTRFYRPPQGKYNTQNLQMAGDLGYKTFFWSLAYVDWIQDQQPPKEAAFDKLLKRIHPGAVVLLHSTSSTNAQILDELLTKWEEMGYHFAPLSELAEKI